MRHRNPAFRGALRSHRWDAVTDYGSASGANWPTEAVCGPADSLALISGLTTYLEIHGDPAISRPFAQKMQSVRAAVGRMRHSGSAVPTFANLLHGLTTLLVNLLGPRDATQVLQGLITAELNVITNVPLAATAAYAAQALQLVERATLMEINTSLGRTLGAPLLSPGVTGLQLQQPTGASTALPASADQSASIFRNNPFATNAPNPAPTSPVGGLGTLNSNFGKPINLNNVTNSALTGAEAGAALGAPTGIGVIPGAVAGAVLGAAGSAAHQQATTTGTDQSINNPLAGASGPGPAPQQQQLPHP